MELKEAIKKRTSIRAFKDDPVPVEDLKELVRMGGDAPSVNNYQPWRFIAVTNKKVLGEMAFEVKDAIENIPENASKASQNVKSQVEWFATFFENAPALIALTMEEYESVLEKAVQMSHEEINVSRNFPDIQSAGAAVQNILLAAVDMGYGACWMSAPTMAADNLNEMIQTEEGFEAFAFIAVGKPMHDKEPKTKKPLQEIFKLIE